MSHLEELWNEENGNMGHLQLSVKCTVFSTYVIVYFTLTVFLKYCISFYKLRYVLNWLVLDLLISVLVFFLPFLYSYRFSGILLSVQGK
jgi:hypothetical protein